ncbi:MAG: ribonuclease Z [Ruminococcaceae bacterium]|nr:ribonuclease Z [Oscillospiraceae bacterium]
MRLILCLDDRNGMMFNHRRQSRDRAVIADILTSVGQGTVFTTAYSVPLFEALGASPICSEELPENGTKEDVYFLEDRSPAPYLERFDSVTVYRWNRHYPADLTFDADLEACGFHLTQCTELVGVSHEKITKECFEK